MKPSYKQSFQNWSKYLLVFIPIFIGNQFTASAQSNFIELNKSFDQLYKSNPDTAYLLNSAILKIGVSENIDSIKAQANLNYSLLKSRERNLDSSILFLEKALPLSKNSQSIEANIYKEIAVYYLRISDYENALSHNLKSLEIFEELNDSASLAKVNNNMGICYKKLDKPEKALHHYRKCYDYGKNDTLIRLYNYVNISNLACITMPNPDTSDLNFLLEGIHFSKNSLNITNHNVTLYIAASYYYYKNSNIETAFKYLDSCKAVVSDENYSLRIEIHGQYSNLYDEIDSVDKLIEHLIIAEDLATNANYPGKLLSINESLADVYAITKQYEKAFYRQKEFQNLKDSLYNIDKINEVNKLQIIHETSEKNKAIELLEKDKIINQAELKRSNILRIAFLTTSVLLLLIGVLLWLRYKNKLKTDKLIQEALEKSFEKKLTDAELQALRAQMNPHFLFNCLNSINSFIIKNEQEKASKYLGKFSKLIRKVLNNSKSSKVTLEDELEALELYIAMESLRFNNKFNYELHIDEDIEVEFVEVPPLIFQPYVENSIWHGLMHKKEGIRELKISIEQAEKSLICTIEDNGIGRIAATKLKSKSATKHKSFGMSITKDRLSHINKKYDIETDIQIIDLENNDGNATGTKVIVNIGIE